jgi:hypothetical protein
LVAAFYFGWVSQHVVIGPLLKTLHRQNAPKDSRGNSELWKPRGGDWVGVLERALYIIANISGLSHASLAQSLAQRATE